MNKGTRIQKGDRVQLRFGSKPKGTVTGTAWGDAVNRDGRKVGRVLWLQVRWDCRRYLNQGACHSVVARDVRLLAAAKGGR